MKQTVDFIEVTTGTVIEIGSADREEALKAYVALMETKEEKENG